MTAAFNLNAIAQTSAVQIVDCLVEGTLIAIFAGLMLGVARRQNSGTRFAVWFSALIAIAALPLLGGAWWPHAASISAATASRPAITLPGSWALYLSERGPRSQLGSWQASAEVFGICMFSARVASRSIRLRYIPNCGKRWKATRLTRAVALCTSDLVHVPTAIGLVKPAVVLPRWVMQELSADELNQILLHELAHLRRWDDWTNLAQKVVKALFFFHPAVWWIEKKVSLEREMACDDAVSGGNRQPARLCGMPGAPGREDSDSAQHRAGPGGAGTDSSDLAASRSDSGRESPHGDGPRLEARGVAGGGIRHGLRLRYFESAPADCV